MQIAPYERADGTTTDGTTTNEVVYSVRQGAGIYSVAVADLSNESATRRSNEATFGLYFFRKFRISGQSRA
jgi:hypothetical protein